MNGILFKRNLKRLLTAQAGEIVFAIDTNEWGLGTGNEIIWRKHELLPNYVYKDDEDPKPDFGKDSEFFMNLSSGKLFKKYSFGWKEFELPIPKEFIDQQYLRVGVVPEPQNTSMIIRNDGSVKTAETYTPYNDKDVVTSGFVEKEIGDFYKTDGSKKLPHDLVSNGKQLAVYKSGMKIALSTENPYEDGVIWNDNGTLRVSENVGIVRYYTTEELGWSDGKSRPVTDGYIDVITNDSVYPTSNRDKVTKGEIIRYGNRTSYNYLFSYCTNMTEFVVSATDESKVTNFYYAWYYCSSLTSFPQLDVSSGANFGSAWYNCSSLTSFPQLDVSSGTDFGWAWGYCHKLPECPLNYLNIPDGAYTGNACDNCCDE